MPCSHREPLLNEAYWEPVGHPPSALPRSKAGRQAGLGHSTRLSASASRHPVAPLPTHCCQGQDQYSWPNIHMYNPDVPDNRRNSIAPPIAHRDIACSAHGRDFLMLLSKFHTSCEYFHVLTSVTFVFIQGPQMAVFFNRLELDRLWHF